jgi:hypothetical protein
MAIKKKPKKKETKLKKQVNQLIEKNIEILNEFKKRRPRNQAFKRLENKIISQRGDKNADLNKNIRTLTNLIRYNQGRSLRQPIPTTNQNLNAALQGGGLGMGFSKAAPSGMTTELYNRMYNEQVKANEAQNQLPVTDKIKEKELVDKVSKLITDDVKTKDLNSTQAEKIKELIDISPPIKGIENIDGIFGTSYASQIKEMIINNPLIASTLGVATTLSAIYSNPLARSAWDNIILRILKAIYNKIIGFVRGRAQAFYARGPDDAPAPPPPPGGGGGAGGDDDDDDDAPPPAPPQPYQGPPGFSDEGARAAGLQATDRFSSKYKGPSTFRGRPAVGAPPNTGTYQSMPPAMQFPIPPTTVPQMTQPFIAQPVEPQPPLPDLNYEECVGFDCVPPPPSNATILNPPPPPVVVAKPAPKPVQLDLAPGGIFSSSALKTGLAGLGLVGLGAIAAKKQYDKITKQLGDVYGGGEEEGGIIPETSTRRPMRQSLPVERTRSQEIIARAQESIARSKGLRTSSQGRFGQPAVPKQEQPRTFGPQTPAQARQANIDFAKQPPFPQEGGGFPSVPRPEQEGGDFPGVPTEIDGSTMPKKVAPSQEVGGVSQDTDYTGGGLTPPRVEQSGGETPPDPRMRESQDTEELLDMID